MKVNYMKMIMAKGVFKMRAAKDWMCVCGWGGVVGGELCGFV